MIIRQLDIENFRGIKSLSLGLDETTVIFGSNNTGKSTIMAAIHSVLNRAFGRKGGIFSEYDYHLSGQVQPTDARRLKLLLHSPRPLRENGPIPRFSNLIRLSV